MFILQIIADTTIVYKGHSALKDILGTETYQAFITQFFFAIIGVTISLLIAGANRDVNKKTTSKFSFIYLLKDSWKRIALNLLVIFVTIRFFKELAGFELSLVWCLAIGLGYDRLIKLLKKKTEFLDVKIEPEVKQQQASAAK